MGEKEKLNNEKVEQEKKSNKKIIKTDIDAKDGQNKCPKCGATDISLNSKTGKLRCNFCRHQFEPEKLETMEKDISKLEGEVLGSGATDIIADVKDILTFKCSSCGAEVVIDTSSQASARCHWCRNTLSVNQQIPNGAIPDTVLPFKVSKADAKKEIETFVGKRKFYAHPEFRKEFTTDNIMGVYLPYMIVDANTHISLTGQGEHEVNRYTEKIGDRTITYYDADLYDVERDFDLTIEGLTIESSKDKLDTNSSNRTNNIINSIMPFDTENCVKWDANYIKGYTSEKRDTNVDDLKGIVEAQSKDIARFAANETLEDYDRGVRWDNENLKLKGQQWKAAYLPIWLYSYQEEKKDKKLLHYVAVNARTKKNYG
jgi:transcription elongation factor Elf1